MSDVKTSIGYAPNVEPSTIEGWRAKCVHLTAENDRLRDNLDSMRTHLADAKVNAASARAHALRQAANVAEYYSVYRGDEKQYPSAVGGDIAALITELDHAPGKRQ